MGDITFQEDYAEFHLQKKKKRKNDQLRKGFIVLIEKQGGAACPVELCARLIKEAGLTKGDHLLANLVKTTGAWKTKKGHLQYSRALELFKQAVKAAGPRPGQIRAAQLACRRYDGGGGRKGA